MSVEIKVPALPESVADATMLEWHKKAGDYARRDENLVDIETEKVVLEVPAPADGTLVEIIRDVGETVTSGDVIARFEPGAEAPADEAEAPQPIADDSGEEDIESTSSPAGPAARRAAAEAGVDIENIAGSGKAGRVLKEDIAAAADSADQPSTLPAAAGKAVESTAGESGGARRERREPMSRLRQTIAARLVQSQQEAAMLTTFNEVDMHAIMELRSRYKSAFEEAHGVKLGFMSFFVKSSVEALKKFPAVNAYIEGTDIVYHDYYDVGIAVSSPRGLVVPVLRDANQKSFSAIESGIGEFGARAKKGTLSIDELSGGTFTITNGGIFGSLVSTPIINPPQSAILGMHKIQQRPVALDGEVVIRPMMYLALSYDHRIVDGREAVSFLVAIKEALEDPTRLLLEL